MNAISCKVCGNHSANKTYEAREMMFGLRQVFQYMHCGQCGCLQLVSIPADMSSYYPSSYYSYDPIAANSNPPIGLKSQVKRLLKKLVLQRYLQGGSLPDSWAKKMQQTYPFFQPGMLSLSSRVLDIGCGAGKLLLQMRVDGFKHLTGLDPFIANDIHYANGVVIHKKWLSELEGSFDVVMLHHAFEHMDQPLQMLQLIHQRLNTDGLLLIRIPVADSVAWERYGVDWVQLDAPRHFFLHTTASMQYLAKQAGFDVQQIVHDSWELQFFGSEKYKRNVPLIDSSFEFTPPEMHSFKEEADRLNREGKGDQACFYLRKKPATGK